MRLVLVHGRGQAGNKAEQLREDWLKALNYGLTAARLADLDVTADVQMPYYGDLLDELTRPLTPPAAGIALGADGGGDNIEDDLIVEIAKRSGITDADIASELPYVELGVRESRLAQAAGRALTKRGPRFADWVMGRLTPDVHAYLTLLHVRAAINSLVSDCLDQPSVVVGHSLGSIVAYWVLTESGTATTVPLLVTLGSPLGMDTVKNRLPQPLGKPAGVKHWFNAADERDGVALFSRLDRDTFPAEIDNLSDVHNPPEDAHGISGYLADPVVARRILEALT